jgi:hypothetical protein
MKGWGGEKISGNGVTAVLKSRRRVGLCDREPHALADGDSAGGGVGGGEGETDKSSLATMVDTVWCEFPRQTKCDGFYRACLLDSRKMLLLKPVGEEEATMAWTSAQCDDVSVSFLAAHTQRRKHASEDALLALEWNYSCLESPGPQNDVIKTAIGDGLREIEIDLAGIGFGAEQNTRTLELKRRPNGGGGGGVGPGALRWEGEVCLRFVSCQRLQGWLSHLALIVVEDPSEGEEPPARGADVSAAPTSSAHRRAQQTSGPQTRPIDRFTRFAQRHQPPYGGRGGEEGNSSLPKETPCSRSREGLGTPGDFFAKEEEDSLREISSSSSLMSLSRRRSLDLKVDTSTKGNTDVVRRSPSASDLDSRSPTLIIIIIII